MVRLTSLYRSGMVNVGPLRVIRCRLSREFVEPLIREAASSYAAADAGWPERTEPCDN